MEILPVPFCTISLKFNSNTVEELAVVDAKGAAVVQLPVGAAVSPEIVNC
jgi:hypothetical protein